MLQLFYFTIVYGHLLYNIKILKGYIGYILIAILYPHLWKDSNSFHYLGGYNYTKFFDYLLED